MTQIILYKPNDETRIDVNLVVGQNDFGQVGRIDVLHSNHQAINYHGATVIGFEPRSRSDARMGEVFRFEDFRPGRLEEVIFMGENYHIKHIEK